MSILFKMINTILLELDNDIRFHLTDNLFKSIKLLKQNAISLYDKNFYLNSKNTFKYCS